MAHNAYPFRYRVRNWHHDNQALIAQCGITFWIDEAGLTTWRNTQARSGSGASWFYSDTAIQGAVVVKSVYWSNSRDTENRKTPVGQGVLGVKTVEKKFSYISMTGGGVGGIRSRGRPGLPAPARGSVPLAPSLRSGQPMK